MANEDDPNRKTDEKLEILLSRSRLITTDDALNVVAAKCLPEW